jgi:hypothetical protein
MLMLKLTLTSMSTLPLMLTTTVESTLMVMVHLINFYVPLNYKQIKIRILYQKDAKL